MTVSDDATINDQDLLYRRIHPKQLAEDIDGSPRLSNAAFKPNQQDELTLSAYLLTALAEIPANPSDCALPGAGHTLAELGVGDVRCLGLGVVRDPVTRAEVPNPCDPAHALTNHRLHRDAQGGRAPGPGACCPGAMALRVTDYQTPIQFRHCLARLWSAYLLINHVKWPLDT